MGTRNPLAFIIDRRRIMKPKLDGIRKKILEFRETGIKVIIKSFWRGEA